MDFMQTVWKQARTEKKRIVLAEGDEKRVLLATGKILENSLADIILIGDVDKIKTEAASLGVDIEGVTIIDPSTNEKFDEYANAFYELRKQKGITYEAARETIKHPIYFATMMLKMNDADGMVAGANHNTSDLLRPGLQIVKTAEGADVVSGFFIMVVPNCDFGHHGLLLFADCAVNPNPTSEQLASIAITTAQTAKSLCNIEPRVAMLSFSTKGSASHELVDKVTTATKIAKEMRPDLAIDGELQLDAAIVKEVADLKAPNSDVAGKANVLVFPDLQTGNIGYKLVQRFAQASAIGPICQGFAKPINDLSRGCSAEDIVNVVAVTAVQAQKNNQN